MLYSALGRSELQASVIGFGCMSLGVSISRATRLVHRAMELGVNYLDTADLYDKGMNEEIIGRMLQGKREQVILATKAGNQWRSDGSGWDWNPRKEYIIHAVEGSLSRLRTDRIDLYQLHGGTIGDPIEETIGAFELLQQQGKIRYYGISSIRPDVIREYVRRSGIISVMLQYSLLDRRAEESVLPLLKEHDIAVMARGSMAKGLLAGKPATEYLNYGAEEVGRAARAVAAISSGGRTSAQTALQFVLANPAITVAVAGLRTMEQLEEVVGTTAVLPLSPDEMQALRGVLGVNYYDQHR